MADFFQTDLIYVLQGVKDFHLFSPLTRKLHIPEIVFTFGKPISHCTYNSLDCLKYISHGSAEEVWWQQSISISLLTQASPNSTCSEFKKKKQEEVLLSPAGPLFISIPFYLGFLRPTLHCSHTWEKNSPFGTVFLDSSSRSEGSEHPRQNLVLWGRVLDRDWLSLNPGFVPRYVNLGSSHNLCRPILLSVKHG